MLYQVNNNTKSNIIIHPYLLLSSKVFKMLNRRNLWQTSRAEIPYKTQLPGTHNAHATIQRRWSWQHNCSFLSLSKDITCVTASKSFVKHYFTMQSNNKYSLNAIFQLIRFIPLPKTPQQSHHLENQLLCCIQHQAPED